jgi:hypothetical protein
MNDLLLYRKEDAKTHKVFLRKRGLKVIHALAEMEIRDHPSYLCYQCCLKSVLLQ